MQAFITANVISDLVMVDKGWFCVRWHCCLFIIVISVMVFWLIRGGIRNRLHELNQERQNLQERLRLTGEELRKIDRSLQPVVAMAQQAEDSNAQDEQHGILRLRLDPDGSITEYS